MSKYILISHALCPYVQRAAISLIEKGLAFERVDIDLANKPDWFLQISPLGKTPVLVVNGKAVFESAVICEYLDETTLSKMHPEKALERAMHRSWIEFASATLNSIAGFYNATDERTLAIKIAELQGRLSILENHLGAGPYFAGENFSLVDAAFAPVFRYFEVFEQIADFAFFAYLPKLTAWRSALQKRASVRSAAHENYVALLLEFLRARGSALSRRMQ
ncbi:glutathione S-transferase family protein [Undibacterium sp. Di27W]|uniref:glutathione S-transferase family protein n=1 Tax=Undibacterium sp. Di27W TaxID=3413036 RepID=UPI003BF432D3